MVTTIYNYTWTFPTGGSPTNFPDPNWFYWYNLPGNNLSMTDDVSMDVFNNPNSGCLIYSVPFAGASNTQDVIVGLFPQLPFFTSQVLDASKGGTINFWIRADPSTAPRKVNGTNADYGTISAGFYYPYSFETQGSATIPLSASNAWVLLGIPINLGSPVLTGIQGIGFNIQTFGTNPAPYPAGQNSIFYLDNVQVAANNQPPPPPTMGAPYKPVSGFNAIATTPGTGGQYNREQIATAADTGYSFIGQNATYSWTVKSFPTGTGGNFQQHFFIVGPVAPGPFDQAADYNLADVFWVTVQQSDAGVASMNFRLKTNEYNGNGMLFNTTSPTDTVNNPNGWPVEPIATLSDPGGAQGTWTVNIQGNTNITVTSPGGLHTNFFITAAQAALFADPVTLILGGQPNNPNGAGKAVVYSSFSATGVANSFTDDFLTDSSFNTSLWITTLASDTNGVVLVPTNALYWVPWSLPDTGFALRTKSQLETSGGWTKPNPLVIKNGSLNIGTNTSGVHEALILSTDVADPTKAYFQLVQYHATMLQVLFAGETNSPSDGPQRFAPNNSLGYTGTATPISGASTPSGATANVTVNAVDASFNIVTSVTDTVSLTSSDPNAIDPLPEQLVNGTLTTQVVFFDVGNWTVTATDTTDPTIASGTSSTIMVNP